MATDIESPEPQTEGNCHAVAVKAAQTRKRRKAAENARETRRRKGQQEVGEREAKRREKATQLIAPLLRRWAAIAPPDVCVVCYEENEYVLQDHHLISGGSEVVKICGSCHNLFNTLKKGETPSHLIDKFKERHSRVSEREALEAKRLKWFSKLCNEAYSMYGFEGLSETLKWMENRANKV